MAINDAPEEADLENDQLEDGTLADDEFELADPDSHPPVRPPGAIRRKTMGGAMLAAAMIGLQEVLEGPKDEPITIEVGSSAGGDDDPVALDLDPFDPSASIAVVRPWLHED